MIVINEQKQFFSIQGTCGGLDSYSVRQGRKELQLLGQPGVQAVHPYGKRSMSQYRTRQECIQHPMNAFTGPEDFSPVITSASKLIVRCAKAWRKKGH